MRQVMRGELAGAAAQAPSSLRTSANPCCENEAVAALSLTVQQLDEGFAALNAVTTLLGAYFLLIDEDGMVIGRNDIAACAIDGRDGKANAVHFADLFAPCPDGVTFSREMKTAGVLGTAAGERCQALFRRSDGSTVPVELTANQTIIDEKPVTFMVFRDVSALLKKTAAAKKQMQARQAELQASKQRLSALTNSIPDALISFDEKGVIDVFNRASERIFGYSITEAIGMHFFDLLVAAKEGDYRHEIESFIETGSSQLIGRHHETEGRRKDGSTFPMEIAISWMEMGSEMHFSATFRDITKRREAEAERAELEHELRQAQKMESLGILAGGIAHEINTPTQYVGDNLRFLLDSGADLQPLAREILALYKDAPAPLWQQEPLASLRQAIAKADLEFYLEEIPNAIRQGMEGVERVREIVQAIKEFSHPDGKEMSMMDINHAIDTTVLVARNQWKYVAEVETDYDEALPPIPCLPGAINQVVLNLVINAAQAIEVFHGGEKGKIRISTRRKGNHVEIKVADNGGGIAPEHLQKVFDPFFTTKEPGQGTGQGLSISHTIITKKHGGTIVAESDYGVGATFTILLPLMAAKKTGETKPTAE
ncbi:MAG: PAS domain-containing sensor histidine kinase [Pseudomonadota bacterium]